MGWDKGKYYTRSRKVRGRVVREYVGGGELGEFAAELDGLVRERREIERDSWRLEKYQIEVLEKSVAEVCQMAEIVARAAMVAAGFHLHRGEWRKRRAR